MVPPALLSLSLALGTLGVLAALPDAPRLDVSLNHELGSPFNVTCTVPAENRSFPLTLGPGGHQAPRTVSITVDNQSFPLTVSPDGHRLTAVVTLNRTGRARVTCAVRAGGVERTTSRTVQGYNVPTPLLSVANTTLVPGAALSGNCSLPAEGITDIQVRVLLGTRVLRGWGQAPLAFAGTVPAEEEKEELELSCEAELLQFRRSHSLLIRVLAKPRLDASSCPPQQNWTEGRDEVLTCRARGRPEPRVECSRNGNSLSAGIPQRARRNHAGSYRCRASNALGTAERNVTLWVQVADPVPLLPVLLGSLLPALALLGLAGLYVLHHRSTKIGRYRLWGRQPPPQSRPLRARGSSQAAPAAPNGAAPSAP